MSRSVRRLIATSLLVPLAAAIYLFQPTLLWSQERALLSGVFTTSVDFLNARMPPEENGEFQYGWYNLANIRYRSRINDELSFYISANVFGLTGYYALHTFSSVSAELERLYFKVGGEHIGVAAGLIRISRGYGYLFSPLDILNPRDIMNSLDPQARPPGRWGADVTLYPEDMWKIEVFGLAPDDPFDAGGWGSKFGGATTFSLGRLNGDILYALFVPEIPYDVDTTTYGLPPYTNNDLTEVVGIGLKADIEIGLYLEALYRFDHGVLKHGLFYGSPFKWYEELQAAAGIDYTFTGGLYLMAEYLFSGSSRVNPQFAHYNYLFLMGRYPAAQDISLGISCLAGIDDVSGLITAFCEYEIVQGLKLQASVLFPVDRTLFDPSVVSGEWGSGNLGFYQMVRLGAQVRF